MAALKHKKFGTATPYVFVAFTDVSNSTGGQGKDKLLSQDSATRAAKLSANALALFEDDAHRFFGGAGEVEQRHVGVTDDEVCSEAFNDGRPATSEQHERARLENVGLELVPDKREFGNRARAASYGDEADRPRDEFLQPLVEVRGRDPLR